jgi:hypothetical protein
LFFRALKLDNSIPLGLVDVSPDLRGVVLYVNLGFFNDLLSDLVGSDVVFWEAVEKNSVG